MRGQHASPQRPPRTSPAQGLCPASHWGCSRPPRGHEQGSQLGPGPDVREGRGIEGPGPRDTKTWEGQEALRGKGRAERCCHHCQWTVLSGELCRGPAETWDEGLSQRAEPSQPPRASRTGHSSPRTHSIPPGPLLLRASCDHPQGLDTQGQLEGHGGDTVFWRVQRLGVHSRWTAEARGGRPGHQVGGVTGPVRGNAACDGEGELTAQAGQPRPSPGTSQDSSGGETRLPAPPCNPSSSHRTVREVKT